MWIKHSVRKLFIQCRWLVADYYLFLMCHAGSCENNTFFRYNYLVTNSYSDIIWGGGIFWIYQCSTITIQLYSDCKLRHEVKIETCSISWQCQVWRSYSVGGRHVKYECGAGSNMRALCTQRQTCHSATLSTMNATWTGPELSLSLCGKRLGITCLRLKLSPRFLDFWLLPWSRFDLCISKILCRVWRNYHHTLFNIPEECISQAWGFVTRVCY